MNPTITSRIFWSIGLTFVRAGVNLATGLLLARFLGAEDFGRFAFLIATFIAIRQLTDLAASNAFFTFLSERPRSKKFVQYYWAFVAAQIALCVGLLLVIVPQSILDRVWQGEPRVILVLACLAAYSQYSIWAATSQMGDASRQTKTVQIVNTLVMILHFAGVIFLYFMNWLALPILFGLIILEWCLGSVIIRNLYVYADPEETGGQTSVQQAMRSYITYCKPLLILTVAVFAFTFADRWMLQAWAGSADQAFLALGLQFASVSLLAVTSVLRILWKEVSEAHAQNNQALLRDLYFRSVRILFAISVFVSATAMPWIEQIIDSFLGPDYQAGLWAMTVLLLVPVSQSLGQVVGTLLLATHQTQLSARIGILFALISLVVSYGVLAPTDMAGLALGVEGLAVKLVVLGFASVWTLSILIKRDYGLPVHPVWQIVIILGVVTLSFGIYSVASFANGFVQIGIHGTLMLALAVAMLLFWPTVFGLDRDTVWAPLIKICPPLAKRHKAG